MSPVIRKYLLPAPTYLTPTNPTPPPLLIGPDHHSNLSSSHINTGQTSYSSLTLQHLLKMELTQCSETSAFNTQTPRKYPEDNSSLLQHGESLKSRNIDTVFDDDLLIGNNKQTLKNY
jgi:hypothetical protein